MLQLNLSSRGALTGMCIVMIGFVLLVLPLIGNIHGIDFLPGRGLEFSGVPTSGGPPAETTGAATVRLIVLVLLRVAAIVFIFLLISDWRYRTYYIVSILFLFGILLMVQYLGLDAMQTEEADDPESNVDWERPIEETQDIQPQEYRDVKSSVTQTIIVAILLASLAITLALIVLRNRLKRRTSFTDDGHDEILESITDAARRLRAGEDARTVVLYCYQEMTRILGREGKIDETYLTPREFQLQLQRLGLSGDSITDLTSLFEIVRYAGRADAGFKSHALACLESIRSIHAHHEA